MMFSLTIMLTEEDAQWLSKPIVGNGGFQRLLRYWNAHRLGKCILLDDPVWIARSAKYVVNDYGNGGFQRRLGKVPTAELQASASNHRSAR